MSKRKKSNEETPDKIEPVANSVEVKPVANSVEVKPLKDWEIHQNKHHIFLIKGVVAPVPVHFIPALITENVIKED